MPNTTISFAVPFDGTPEEPIELVGYLFDARDKLIASAPGLYAALRSVERDRAMVMVEELCANRNRRMTRRAVRASYSERDVGSM